MHIATCPRHVKLDKPENITTDWESPSPLTIHVMHIDFCSETRD